jgi:enoyl-[acyl-carrier-protein] reductase (NADH)
MMATALAPLWQFPRMISATMNLHRNSALISLSYQGGDISVEAYTAMAKCNSGFLNGMIIKGFNR